jgi:hypothetical protein
MAGRMFVSAICPPAPENSLVLIVFDCYESLNHRFHGQASLDDRRTPPKYTKNWISVLRNCKPDENKGLADI